MTWGPKNAREAAIFAEEGLRVAVQCEIQKLLNRRGWSRKDLAKSMGVSEPRLSQMLSDEANLTTRNIARLFFAMGARVQLNARLVRRDGGGR